MTHLRFALSPETAHLGAPEGQTLRFVLARQEPDTGQACRECSEHGRAARLGPRSQCLHWYGGSGCETGPVQGVVTPYFETIEQRLHLRCNCLCPFIDTGVQDSQLMLKPILLIGAQRVENDGFL